MNEFINKNLLLNRQASTIFTLITFPDCAFVTDTSDSYFGFVRMISTHSDCPPTHEMWGGEKRGTVT